MEAYQQRVVDEKTELDGKLTKLAAFQKTTTFVAQLFSLDREPAQPKPENTMKLKTPIMLGAVIVGSGALLGCERELPKTLPPGYYLQTDGKTFRWVNGQNGDTAVYPCSSNEAIYRANLNYFNNSNAAVEEAKWHNAQ